MKLSEDDIIETFFAPLTASAPNAFALTDDAAILPQNDKEEFVVTVDTLVAGVHFFADDAPDDIAIKSLAVNLSDLAAKGATPKYYLLSLSLPKSGQQATQRWLKDFASGLRRSQTQYEISLLGGDTVSTNGPLTISVTAIGAAAKYRTVLRSTANVGDKIFVTGTIGDAFLGLKIREEPSVDFAQTLSAEARNYLRGKYLRPIPRCEVAHAIGDFASAAMDISDGFVGDLKKLCKASRVGAKVSIAQVPHSDAAEEVLSSMPELRTRLLTSGDDYELLVTLPPSKTHDFQTVCEKHNVPAFEVGTIDPLEDGVCFTDADGNEISFDNERYSHF